MSEIQGTGLKGDTEEKRRQLKRIAGQAVANEAFFLRLKNDPKAACSELGITLTAMDVQHMRSMDWVAMERGLRQVRTAMKLEVTRASW